jgi:hypothetical protein
VAGTGRGAHAAAADRLQRRRGRAASGPDLGAAAGGPATGRPAATDVQREGAEPGAPGQPGGPEAGAADDPNVVAVNLTLPWGLAVLPDGTALVGERTTGRLLIVQPQRAPAKPVMRIPGVDATGDGGLLGLALSPSYGEDGLVYAYVTTRTDNRVVRFALKGPVTPVLNGIPRGAPATVGGSRSVGRHALRRHRRRRQARAVRQPAQPGRQGAAGRHVRPAGQEQPDPSSPVYSLGHGRWPGSA